MKKIFLSFPIILFIGCATNNTTHINQPSIAMQKIEAQKAWDELDGKTPQYQKNYNINTKENNLLKPPKETIKSSLKITNSIPEWFYAPPQSNKYFYGSGEGSTLKQAEISALDFIAREIQTTISSNLNITQGTNNNNGNSDFYKMVQQNINTQVKKINFTNIEIIKTIKVNNSIYTLVRINKQTLFNSLKTQFELLDSKIDNEIKISKNYSLLDQLITLNKIQSQISKAISQATILNSLNPDFNIQKYTEKYNNYLNQKTKILHKLTFNINSNDLFTQKLIEVLNQNGYKISNNSNIKIKLKKQIRNSDLMGLAISKVTINIQVIAKNKILHSTSLEVKGISNNYSQALANAANNFKQQLQEKGINKVLGFE